MIHEKQQVNVSGSTALNLSVGASSVINMTSSTMSIGNGGVPSLAVTVNSASFTSSSGTQFNIDSGVLRLSDKGVAFSPANDALYHQFFAKGGSDAAGPVYTPWFLTAGAATTALEIQLITPSDVRLKTDVRSLSGKSILSSLDLIAGVRYTWNEVILECLLFGVCVCVCVFLTLLSFSWQLAQSLGMAPDREEIGFLAQQVREVFPELVSRIRGGDGKVSSSM